MSAKRKGLGRGLDALLSAPGAASASAETPQDGDAGEAKNGRMATLGVDQLRRGQYQPRTDMRSESLEDLAESIRQQGIMQPIVVRKLAGAGGNYEIIAGERRWRAAQLAELQSVPVIIRDVTDETALALSLIENIQRENLNPLEEALALSRLVNEFGLTHAEAAQAVGRSRAAVSNLLRLLDLDDQVKAMLEQRILEMGHARALLALPTERQAAAAEQVSARRMSVRDTEKLVKQLLNGPSNDATVKEKARRDPDIVRLEGTLGEKLGAQVHIAHGSKGGGKLSIAYNSVEELEGILAHIK